MGCIGCTCTLPPPPPASLRTITHDACIIMIEQLATLCTLPLSIAMFNMHMTPNFSFKYLFEAPKIEFCSCLPPPLQIMHDRGDLWVWFSGNGAWSKNFRARYACDYSYIALPLNKPWIRPWELCVNYIRALLVSCIATLFVQ